MNRDWSLIAFAIASALTVASLAPAEVLAAAPSLYRMQEPAPPGDAERAMFTQGQNLFMQGSYTRAAEVLEKFLDTYPNSILTDLTLLWLGRSYFQLGRFSEAEELGKRLRAIKDTPFADIYDTELRTALREVAKQQSMSLTEKVSTSSQSQIISSATPTAGRNRYAKARASTLSPPPPGAKRTAANTARRPIVRRPSTTKSGQPNAAKNSVGKSTRQSAKAAPVKSRLSSSPANKIVRAGASPGSRRQVSDANKPPQRPGKPGAAAGKSSNVALRRSPPSQRKIAAKPKPSSPGQTSRRDSASRVRSVVPSTTIAKRGERQSNTKTALSSGNRKPNSPRQNSPERNRIASSNRRNSNSANNRGAVSNAPGTRRSADNIPVPADVGSDSPRPAAVNEHAATGGLYSMIDVTMGSGPTNVTPETRVDVKSRGMNAKPGETIYLSFVVRNYSSTRQTYELRVTAPGAPEAQLYVDSNGDGMHQSDELRVTGSPVIELKNSEVPFLLEVSVPRSASEGQQYSYTVTVLSFGNGEVIARATSMLTVSSIRASLLPANIPENSRPFPAK